ncbi:MAG: hypothetical protein AAF249_13305 [Pseudomonadota bacterium]
MRIRLTKAARIPAPKFVLAVPDTMTTACWWVDVMRIDGHRVMFEQDLTSYPHAV